MKTTKHRNIWAVLGAAILAACLLFAGCGGAPAAQTQKAGDGTFHIVTSFYPMYIDVINLTDGVEGVTVTNMTKPQTGCLHDYQLTTEDMKTLEKADAFVVNGAGMESFLDKVIKMQEGMTVIDASRGIELMEEDGEANPHVWLSITKDIEQVKNIRDQLKEADPAHADQYEANAETYLAKLEALKTEMHATLDDVPHKDIVTFHEAFPYFAKAYGLEVVAVVTLEPDEPVSPRMLKQIIQRVKDAGNPPLFSEPQYENTALRTIAQETGAKVYELDPLVTGDGSLTAYEDTMRKNLATLAEALGAE